LRVAVEGRSFFRGIGKFGELPRWKEHGVLALARLRQFLYSSIGARWGGADRFDFFDFW
jgi:hypothetical protein